MVGRLLERSVSQSVTEASDVIMENPFGWLCLRLPPAIPSLPFATAQAPPAHPPAEDFLVQTCSNPAGASLEGPTSPTGAHECTHHHAPDCARSSKMTWKLPTASKRDRERERALLSLLLFVAALCFTLLFGAYVPRYPLLPNSPLQNGVQQSARQGLGRETTSSGPYKEKERQREREREKKKTFWLKSTCRRPPREGGTRGRPAGGAESGLCFSGGWTFSRVGGGLSHYVAMFLLASARGPSR